MSNILFRTLVIPLILLSGNAIAQLTTEVNVYTPEQLVNNVLLGGGVTASNIVYTGSPTAIGKFNGANTNIGLNSGIIMNTGTVQIGTNGPQGPNNSASSGVDNGQAGDPILAGITGQTSTNAARLEFDFVPTSDSIQFNFVFGSEEYPEFVNASYNDAFGFFITGPNPAGGSFTNENIALVPGTTTPISIDNVNAGSNSSYYVNNSGGPTIQYDGFTTPITAKSPVICGQTYHIILVISDMGDGQYDSAVFLEEGSFSSSAPVTISSQFSFQGTDNDSTLYEGCSQVDFNIVRADSIDIQQTFNLDITATATLGVDCSNIPTSVTFQPGEDTVTISVSAFEDFITETDEWFQIAISSINSCGEEFTDSVKIYIGDVDSLQVNTSEIEIVCPGDTIQISSIVTGGRVGYNYLWSNGATTSSTMVWPTSDTTFYITVTDTCGNTDMDSVMISFNHPAPLSINIINDTTHQCPGIQKTLTAVAQNGYDTQYSFTWNNTSTENNITVQPNETTTYYATVQDACGFVATDSATITINEPPLNSTITLDTTICLGDSVNLVTTGIGGVGSDYEYLWSNGATDSSVIVSPNNTTTYSVQIKDGCGYFKAFDTVKVETIEVIANFLVAGGPFESGDPIYLTNTSINGNSYVWTFDEDNITIQENPEWSYENDGTYEVLLVATNDQYGCVDSIVRPIKVNPEYAFYAPNSFTPDGNEFNQTWKIQTVGIQQMSYNLLIFNRWGEVVWESKDPAIGWDGTFKGQSLPVGVYVYKIELVNLRNETKTYSGHINLLR